MPRSRKLPLDAVLRMLAEEGAADREAERALAMTDEEVTRALEAAGLTKETIEADARAMAARIPMLAEELLAAEGGGRAK
jgi:hypothetical protein